MAPRSKRRAVAADGAGELPEDERAFQKVVRVVNIREQSTVTMRRKLEQAGFGEAAVEAALERARDAWLIDDRRYAEALVRATLASGKGLRRAERAREGLGIALEEVEAFQDHEQDGGPSEVERAMAVLSRKRFTAKNKREAAYRTLVGKGYASDAASTAARLWAEGG